MHTTFGTQRVTVQGTLFGTIRTHVIVFVTHTGLHTVYGTRLTHVVGTILQTLQGICFVRHSLTMRQTL